MQGYEACERTKLCYGVYSLRGSGMMAITDEVKSTTLMTEVAPISLASRGFPSPPLAHMTKQRASAVATPSGAVSGRLPPPWPVKCRLATDLHTSTTLSKHPLKPVCDHSSRVGFSYIQVRGPKTTYAVPALRKSPFPKPRESRLMRGVNSPHNCPERQFREPTRATITRQFAHTLQACPCVECFQNRIRGMNSGP